MDELHEELKQPLPCNLDENDSDGNAIEDGHTFIASHDRQLSMDSNSSSQSEDFYETCDSSLSSDRCSADVNVTGEQGETQNVESTILSNNKTDSNSRVSGGKTYARLRQVEGSKSAPVEDSVVASKHLKETVNHMSKRTGGTVTVTSTDESGHPDDIPSDGEMSQNRVRSRSSPRLKQASETSKSRNSYSTKHSVQRKGTYFLLQNVMYQRISWSA